MRSSFLPNDKCIAAKSIFDNSWHPRDHLSFKNEKDMSLNKGKT